MPSASHPSPSRVAASAVRTRIPRACGLLALALVVTACDDGDAPAAPSPPPAAISAVTFATDSLALESGDTVTLAPVASTAGPAVAVRWQYVSSANGVVTVSEAGALTAIAAGRATITASATGSGAGFATTTLSGTVAVTVRDAVLGIGFGDAQFAVIPAGAFRMGSETGATRERPVRTVTLTRAFAMQRTEVTQAQWRRVMAGTGLERPSRDSLCGDTCPVEQVSWEEIQQFLARLNAQHPGHAYRLPTEAEWEYAARAGSTGDYGGTGLLDEMGWWFGNSGQRAHPVAQKLPNAFGLYDMHGNIWEWVNDWYDATYYDVAPSVDPPGPASGTLRVLRGGHFSATASGVRSSDRNNETPDDRSGLYGFRLVRAP